MSFGAENLFLIRSYLQNEAPRLALIRAKFGQVVGTGLSRAIGSSIFCGTVYEMKSSERLGIGMEVGAACRIGAFFLERAQT
jgi:hypothetical protein